MRPLARSRNLKRGSRNPGLVMTVQYAIDARGLPSRAQIRRWARAALERDARVTVRIVGSREAGVVTRLGYPDPYESQG